MHAVTSGISCATVNRLAAGVHGSSLPAWQSGGSSYIEPLSDAAFAMFQFIPDYN